jgi:hypothetical protein
VFASSSYSQRKSSSIKDENKISFNVRLYPKEKCSCDEKTARCCHLLAVYHLNGASIEELYKMPNLDTLIKSKNNNQSQGRMGRHHARNTVSTKPAQLPVADIDEFVQLEPVEYLYELLLLDKEYVDEYIESGRQFGGEDVIEVAFKLSECFLNGKEPLTWLEPMLSSYFDDAGWLQVETVVKSKIKYSTCPGCSSLCHKDFKKCAICHYSSHFVCASVSKHHQKSVQSKWKCEICTKK